MRSSASETVPRFTAARFFPSPAPAGGPSATANASGARAHATSRPAACLQNGRDHEAGQVHFAFTLPEPSAKAIEIL
ncbi:MAG: hypothetical protein QM820_15145 [Minicystis sp.]